METMIKVIEAQAYEVHEVSEEQQKEKDKK